MNTELHQTPVKTRLAPKSNPVRIFIDKERMAWFWFLIAVATIAAAAVDRFYLVQNFKQRERVVILDPAGTYHVSALLDFDEAKTLHAEQATLATVAFLERNPKGFDHPELLKKLFLKEALRQANMQRAKEEREFAAKQIHQKVEISKVDILQTRQNDFFTEVAGQLIRTGIFNEKVFTEVIPFKVTYQMQRNPDMTKNGRFPAAVSSFRYEPAN